MMMLIFIVNLGMVMQQNLQSRHRSSKIDAVLYLQYFLACCVVCVLAVIGFTPFVVVVEDLDDYTTAKMELHQVE